MAPEQIHQLCLSWVEGTRPDRKALSLARQNVGNPGIRPKEGRVPVLSNWTKEAAFH